MFTYLRLKYFIFEVPQLSCFSERGLAHNISIVVVTRVHCKKVFDDL